MLNSPEWIFNKLCTAVIYNDTYSFYTETLLMMHQTAQKTTSIKLQTENKFLFNVTNYIHIQKGYN